MELTFWLKRQTINNISRQKLVTVIMIKWEGGTEAVDKK